MTCGRSSPRQSARTTAYDLKVRPLTLQEAYVRLRDNDDAGEPDIQGREQRGAENNRRQDSVRPRSIKCQRLFCGYTASACATA